MSSLVVADYDTDDAEFQELKAEVKAETANLKRKLLHNLKQTQRKLKQRWGHLN